MLPAATKLDELEIPLREKLGYCPCRTMSYFFSALGKLAHRTITTSDPGTERSRISPD
jgi:hypothetical protein